MGARPIIVAHRGLRTRAPENSWSALRAAWRAGITWVECDVHASADGHPIVIHDPTLDRTTVQTGPVAAMTAAQLARIHLRRPDGRPHWSHVPILHPGLARSDGRGALLVEIKPPDSPQLVKRVIRYLRLTRPLWTVQSFDRMNVLHAQRIAPDRRHVLLVENQADLERACAETWPTIHAPHASLTEAVVRRLHEQGRAIGAWTVNLEPDIRRMIDLGVDMIITDEPERALRLAGVG